MKFVIALLLAVSVSANAVLDNVDVKTATGVDVTTTSAVKLSANKFRQLLVVQNQHATTPLYLAVSSSASATTGAIKIAGGATYEPVKAPIDAIYLFTASGSVSATVVEGN